MCPRASSADVGCWAVIPMTDSKSRIIAKQFGSSALVGLSLGAAVFVLETLLIFRAGVAGVNIEVQGTLAALMSVVKPHLPLLLARIAISYAVAGLVLGAAGAALVSALPLAGGARRAALAIEIFALAAFLIWDRAIERPALLDDLPAARLWLVWLLDRGHPWQPRLAALLWIAAHLVVAFHRWGLERLAPRALATLAAMVLCTASVSGSVGPAHHSLVVLIGVDAFRADRVTALGASKVVAPNLEAFLANATLFEQAYTPIAQTEPAWRSLLTARWPHRHGDRYPLTAESRWETSTTFPVLFSEAGYRTMFATDCSRFNYQGALSGFQESLQPPRGAINFVLEKLRYRALGMFGDNALGAWWLPEFIDNRALAGLHDPMGYADRLAATLVQRAQAGPLMFAFHATAAHFPGDPVYPFYRKYVSASEPLERRTRMSFAPITGAVEGGGTREGSEALYDELLAQADTQVGILLQALKDHGLYEHALIAIFSDHGESFHADAPWLEGATPVHGARLGEEENRILLGIKLPDEMHSSGIGRVNALVRLVDIAPTLLEAKGLRQLPGADGESLLPLIQGKSVPPRRLYAETGFTHARPDAFDADHLTAAPRSLDAYRIRADGVIELSEEAHQAVLREKDVGTFDGRRWIIRSPRKDGTTVMRCLGDCADQRPAVAWLDEELGERQ